MRGKVPKNRKTPKTPRITPAGAGKSIVHQKVEMQCPDHPRGCGEKVMSGSLSLASRGSPPRVRGKAREDDETFKNPGITPAGAGKRPMIRQRKCCRKDHPRGCGEKPFQFFRRLFGKGSPPRVRGKELHGHCAAGSRGITPAGAGKSLKMDRLDELERDHPRGCGEKKKNKEI